VYKVFQSPFLFLQESGVVLVATLFLVFSAPLALGKDFEVFFLVDLDGVL
jgi:hypothetical protein